MNPGATARHSALALCLAARKFPPLLTSMRKTIPFVIAVCALLGLCPAAAQSFYLSSSPYVGYDSMTVAAADFNGDGSIDLAGFDNNEVLTILTNNGNGSFSVCSTNRYFFSIQSITAADVNHDGKVDIITANRYDNTITLLTNKNARGVNPPPPQAPPKQP